MSAADPAAGHGNPTRSGGKIFDGLSLASEPAQPSRSIGQFSSFLITPDFPLATTREARIIIGSGDYLSSVSTGAEPFRQERARRNARTLKGFDSLDEEAAEEGYAAPTVETREEAQRILRSMLEESDLDFDVYPLEAGAIAIEARARRGAGILIRVEPQGTAACFVTVDGDNRRCRYGNSARLPDSFLHSALSELAAAAKS